MGAGLPNFDDIKSGIIGIIGLVIGGLIDVSG